MKDFYQFQKSNSSGLGFGVVFFFFWCPGFRDPGSCFDLGRAAIL